MLIVLAQAKLGEGAADQARDAISTMVTESNKEDGCIAYAFTTDMLDPSVIHIVEKWRDEAALIAHFQTPHMADFQQAIAGLDVTITDARKFETDEGRPLG